MKKNFSIMSLSVFVSVCVLFSGNTASYGQEEFTGEIVKQALVEVVPPEEESRTQEQAGEEPAVQPEEAVTLLEDISRPGSEGEAASLPEGMEGNLSLDLRNIDVTDAMKFLAVKAGLNIITTKNVAGRITLMVENVRIKDIFDIMLRSNDLAFIKQGDIYNVMTEEEYKAIYGRRFSDLRQVKVFRLQYAIPDQTFSMLDALKSEIGRVLVEPDSGTVLIMDTPDNIANIEQALGTLEQRNTIQVFNLKYAKAKDMEEQLKTQLDAKKVGSIKADDRSNQLIIQALPDRMVDIQRLVEALDTKTKEILIDTQIIKVKLTNELATGIEWEGILDTVQAHDGLGYVGTSPFSVLQASTESWMSRNDFRLAQGNDVGAIPFSGNTSSVSSSAKVIPGEKMHLGIVNSRSDIDVLIKYLQTLGKTQILSNPKIAVTNNQEAKIHVGERQAYVTTTTTTGQSSSTVSEEVTFVDVGIQLMVTPTINDDGFVTMKVKPEVSSVVSSLTTPSGNTIPIIDTSTAETTVLVKDGSTIVIGGLRREEKTSSSQGIPFLSKIPILGMMFQMGTSDSERTELLVLMTPHVVSGDSLTTGDDREFGGAPGPAQEYHEYKPLNEETDIAPGHVAPEDKIKPYRDYLGFNTQPAGYPSLNTGEHHE
ncbi:MAG: type II secretion system protein GspD [Candidatus Omnitrophica bacterium]|nr:type II secretion system protein GspD [Candidatus Omnitrophota bacterium]